MFFSLANWSQATTHLFFCWLSWRQLLIQKTDVISKATLKWRSWSTFTTTKTCKCRSIQLALDLFKERYLYIFLLLCSLCLHRYFDIDVESIKGMVFNEHTFASCFMNSPSFKENVLFLPINLVFKLERDSSTLLRKDNGHLRISRVSSVLNGCWIVFGKATTVGLVARNHVLGTWSASCLRTLWRRC